MKMKLVATTLSVATLFSGAALAMDFNPKFYVGAEAQYNKLNDGKKVLVDQNNRSQLHNNAPAADLFVGSRLTENLGVEAGYTAMKDSKKDAALVAGAAPNAKTTVKMHNAHIDAMGYVPVCDDIELIGSVGAGRLSTKVGVKQNNGTVVQVSDIVKKASKSKTGIRLGVGAQYNITSNVGARVMLRHQKGNKLVKSVNSVGAGLFYQFKLIQ